MRTWRRIFSFVWPYRRRLALSVVFGVIAALLWSFVLLLTFPITVMFDTKHGTLANFVKYEKGKTAEKIEIQNLKLLELDQKLETLPENGERRRVTERVEVFEKQQRILKDLDTLTSRQWMLGLVETKIVRNLPDDQFRLFAVLFGFVLLVILAKGIAGYCQDVLAGGVAELVVIDLRQAMFRRLLRLDPQTIEREGTSGWLNDFTSTLQCLADNLAELGGRVIREPLKAVSCLSALLYMNWRLTLIFLFFTPLLGILFHWMGQRLKRAANRVIESMGRIYKSLEETFHNAKAVIVFDRAGKHRREFHRENKMLYTQAMRLAQIDAMGGPLSELLGMLAASAVLLPAAFLVLRETSTIWMIPLASSPPTFPEFVEYYVLLAGTLEPVRKFSKFYNSIRLSTTIAERVFQRMDGQSMIVDPVAPQILPPLQKTIEFRDVNFQYARSNGDTTERGPVLNGLNLTIRAGQTVALVGSNGSGKSTLVNLLPRFYDPDRGEVLFDGVNLKEVRVRDVREQIALVPQETILFDDSILENIRYGRPDATDAEVRNAAIQAHVLSFAQTMPQELMTRVGEQGKQLSGGQRQRIALARAILRDPGILVLDEPTSAIDAQSEQLIYESLRKFARNRTTIIITHCLTPTLLEFLSQIIVLDSGRVVAAGSHAELLATSPTYQRLWESQSQRSAA